MNLWTRKLAAYLHDPPEKCYDFGSRHVERAKTHATNFSIGDLWKKLSHFPDWSAAASDLFIFPSGRKIDESLGEDTCPCFIHPISGRIQASTPAFPSEVMKFPNQSDAEEWIGEISPAWTSDDPQNLFLRAWRNWSANAASHARGTGKGAELLPYLPADTRISDASIWHHCAIVSALEATRASDDPASPLQPAFLLFQVGPVQEFIAQARSTRDLWSGSYLLSWLTMHAIKAVADKCGPDAIIFPSLKGQPLYDFLEHRLNLRRHDNEVLVPGIPNRFLALVPFGFDVEGIVARAFRDEWELIASECQKWLEGRGIPFIRPTILSGTNRSKPTGKSPGSSGRGRMSKAHSTLSGKFPLAKTTRSISPPKSPTPSLMIIKMNAAIAATSSIPAGHGALITSSASTLSMPAALPVTSPPSRRRCMPTESPVPQAIATP